jgi:hypothetical protein
MLRQFKLNLIYIAGKFILGMLNKNYIQVFREVWQKMT